MTASVQEKLEQHRHHILRARALIEFVRERPFMFPDWNRLARAAYAAGLFHSNCFVDNARMMKRLWMKRGYWTTAEAEKRYCSGGMLPLDARGHLLENHLCRTHEKGDSTSCQNLFQTPTRNRS